jgi:S1-C subfamily serine protease
MRRPVRAAVPLLVALLVLGGCVSKAEKRASGQGNGTTTAALATGDIPSVVRAVEPSIVTIYVGEGLGSGIVYRGNGIIVTNEHVVHGAERVAVGFADGRRVDGQVLATDAVSDLAVVKVSRSGLPAARFDVTLPPVGALAIALGSPLGFSNTATAGIVSGLGRTIPASGPEGQPMVDLIQTDAAISPGNSGGALVNGAGAVIGVNEAYIPPSAGAVSLGFAIPAATAVNVVEQLLETGRAQHAYLGVQPAALTPELAKDLGVDRTDGVLVMTVGPKSPAAAAGLQPGDIILSVGGTPTPTPSDLYAALRQRKPGEKVDVRVLRDGAERTVSVTLGDRPA